MAIKYPVSTKEEPILTARNERWIRGLNTTVSNTQTRPDELTLAQDVQLVEDGKVQCPRDGQAYFASSQGSRVTGLFTFYKSNGTKQLLRISGTTLYEYNPSTSNWDSISGFTYTANLNANAVTAYDKLYICNGTDNLTYFDGTDITSFTGIASPAAPTVARTGTTGSYTFSYKITAVTDVGETLPSAAGTDNLNQATLDASNYMSVSWSAVTNAVGYNVFGRKDGQWYFMKYIEGNASVSYVDKGQDTPSSVYRPPEGNTTGGPVGKYITLYKDSLFIFGDPTNPSRLYYSGGGDKINDFTIGNGGGFIDISKNDGQVGTGIITFKNTLLVFKENSIYQFSFSTSGLPQVVQINSAIGAIAPRSIIAVENDVFFASRRGIFTIGNEAGFSFDVLRTNELSARIRSIYNQIDPAYIDRISAIYTTDSNKNLVIFSYTPSGDTTNTKAIVYDRERLAWYYWTNVQANCWTAFQDATGSVHYLYGDDSSGYVKEILSGTSDFGTSIRGIFRVRSESFKALERYKTLKNIAVILRNPSGRLTMNVVVDGVNSSFTQNIGTVSPSVNWGHYQFSRFTFVSPAVGTGVSSQDSNVVRRVRNVNLLGRSFMLEFDNMGTAASFVLLETYMEAKNKSPHYYGESEVTN